MHQPYYKDDLQNQFLLPWVRLRCAKDYYKMPALLADYPAIKQTFNLVPALVAQVQDYADGGSSDVYLELARRPASELSADERAFVARWMTESSQIRRVREYRSEHDALPISTVVPPTSTSSWPAVPRRS